MLQENTFNLKLSGDESYYTNSQIFLVKNMMCSEFHSQKVLNCNSFYVECYLRGVRFGGRAPGVGPPEEAAPDSRICVLGTFFRLWVAGFGLGFRLLGFGSRVLGFGTRDSGFEIRDLRSGFRVEGVGRRGTAPRLGRWGPGPQAALTAWFMA